MGATGALVSTGAGDSFFSTGVETGAGVGVTTGAAGVETGATVAEVEAAKVGAGEEVGAGAGALSGTGAGSAGLISNACEDRDGRTGGGGWTGSAEATTGAG